MKVPMPWKRSQKKIVIIRIRILMAAEWESVSSSNVLAYASMTNDRVVLLSSPFLILCRFGDSCKFVHQRDNEVSKTITVNSFLLLLLCTSRTVSISTSTNSEDRESWSVLWFPAWRLQVCALLGHKHSLYKYIILFRFGDRCRFVHRRDTVPVLAPASAPFSSENRGLCYDFQRGDCKYAHKVVLFILFSNTFHCSGLEISVDLCTRGILRYQPHYQYLCLLQHQHLHQ